MLRLPDTAFLSGILKNEKKELFREPKNMRGAQGVSQWGDAACRVDAQWSRFRSAWDKLGFGSKAGRPKRRDIDLLAAIVAHCDD